MAAMAAMQQSDYLRPYSFSHYPYSVLTAASSSANGSVSAAASAASALNQSGNSNANSADRSVPFPSVNNMQETSYANRFGSSSAAATVTGSTGSTAGAETYSSIYGSYGEGKINHTFYTRDIFFPLHHQKRRFLRPQFKN